MKKATVHFLPADIHIEADDGASLLETARRAGYILQSECGGQGTCRRCKVILQSGEVFLTGEQNLTEAEKQNHFVLACMARVTGEAEIEIPESSQLKFVPDALKKELTPGEHPGKEILKRGYKLRPQVSCATLQIPPISTTDNRPDFERVSRLLQESDFPPPYHTDVTFLQHLPRIIRNKGAFINVYVHPREHCTHLLHINEDNGPYYGLALDIGTTTLFARLIDQVSGMVLAEASDFNAQIPCGGDIIHRIVYAAKEGGRDKLRQLVLKTTNGLVDQLLHETGIEIDAVVACVAAGNTTMEHLFLGIDPKYIREEPYVPAVVQFPELRASDVGIDILPTAPVLFSPSVASYVGGDVAAGLLAANVHRSDKLTLYVDLGTNGEIALGNRDWLTACACSAGPAFEGSGVKCGMRALPGGIDKVEVDATDASLRFNIIGGGTPRGICGSGMIDLLAALRATGRITPRGKLDPEADPQRIRKQGRKAEIVLVKGKNKRGTDDIVVTDADIDNLVRTKGAIFAGIMTLCKGVGLEVPEIERVVIAGAFGRYLDIDHAIRIGMLPDLPRERFEYIGNGSLRGCGMALLSQTMWRELHEIAGMITYFELSSWPGYMDEFMASLFLPHTDGSLFPSVER